MGRSKHLNKFFPSSTLLQAFSIVSSLCCYSQVFGANATVNNATYADLATAITTANAGGGTITFNIPAGSTITLISSLPVLAPTAGSITLNNTSVPINIVGNGNQVFFALSGTININDINVSGGGAVGGVGGTSLQDGLHGGGGGGGGLGAGAGLFVANGATVTLTDVVITGNTATGGAGGNGGGGTSTVGGGGAGGGGIGAVGGGTGGAGGNGGGQENLTSTGAGGGGGGGGNTPGLNGFTGAAINGGNGGNGGGPSPGTGGTGGAPGNGSNGTTGGANFSGGGGGGGAGGGTSTGGNGGTGAAFAGGGGGGGNALDSAAGFGVGAAGGFGGGGGGGGTSAIIMGGPGGNGGFGGGAGGGGGTSGSVAGFGGGAPTASSGGGGGGASLGGGIFVQQGGTLNINYASVSTDTPISGNTVNPSNGGNLATGGMAIAPDIFLMSGGNLTFDLSRPITISTDLASDGLIAGNGITVTGHSVLTLTGANTYNGGTTVDAFGTLAIDNDGNLGAAGIANGITLSNGLLELLGDFSTSRIVTIGSGGGAIQVDQAAATADMLGRIVGTGGLFAIGPGTVVLESVSNNYMGGTTINGGTVVITSPANLGSSTATLELEGGTLLINPPFGTNNINASTVLFNAAGATFVTGDPSVQVTLPGNFNGGGSGPINFNGSGQITLSGNNVYSGVSTIGSGSTLEIVTALSLPAASNVVDNGTLVFSGFNGTIANSISGSGSVFLDGSNAYIFTGVNTYAGMTTINTATTSLQINDADSFPAGGAVVDAGTLIFNQPTGTISPGNISGNGSVVMQGTGTLVLNGTNSYLGSTTVVHGTLFVGGSLVGPTQVDTGAVLTGSGTAGNLTNDGTVTPVGTLTVNGNYIQNADGIFDVGITGMGTNDLLKVSGNATLDGTINVTATPGNYFAGETFTVLTSTAGLILAPGFTTINLPSFLNLQLTYDPLHNVVLTVLNQLILTNSHAHHHNPQQVLKNLQALNYASDPGLFAVVSTLGTLSSSQFSNALDQLHPAIFGAFELMNLNTSTLVASFFNRQMAEICCLHLDRQCGCKEMSVWLQPFGYSYRQDRIKEQVGFHSDTEGLIGGFNYCFNNGILIGGGGGYSKGSIDWKDHRGHGVVDSGYLGLYTDYHEKPIYVEAALVGGVNSYQASRHIEFANIHRHAKHDKLGYDFTAHVGGGGDIKFSKNYLKPFANIDYLFLYQEGFKEHGAGSLNLSVKSRHTNMLRSELGLSFTHSYPIGEEGCWSPTIWLSGINECYLRKRHYHSSFEGQSIGFEVRTFNKPIYLISPGIDLSFTLKTGLSFSARYGAELNGQITTQKVDGRLEWFF